MKFVCDCKALPYFFYCGLECHSLALSKARKQKSHKSHTSNHTKYSHCTEDRESKYHIYSKITYPELVPKSCKHVNRLQTLRIPAAHCTHPLSLAIRVSLSKLCRLASILIKLRCHLLNPHTCLCG